VLSLDVEKTNHEWMAQIHHIKDPYVTMREMESLKSVSAPRPRSGLFGLFSDPSREDTYGAKKEEITKTDLSIDPSPLRSVPPVKGLYMYGGPGSGKTFMMDMFAAQVRVANKKRAHYNEFMLSIHKMNHKFQKAGVYDPLFRTAREVGTKIRLLCLDELQVTDIGDAVLIKRLFDILWKHKIVLVVGEE
jgi:predicted ATPase